MKKSFNRRLRRDLFPKTPQSFVRQIRAALPIEEVDASRENTQSESEPELYVPEKHRLQFWPTLATGIMGVVTAAALLLVVFVAMPSRKPRTESMESLPASSRETETKPPVTEPPANTPEPVVVKTGESEVVGTWELCKLNYGGVLISASAMRNNAVKIVFQADGTAALQEYAGLKPLTVSYTFDGSTVTLIEETDFFEAGQTMAYDAEAGTLTAYREKNGMKIGMLFRREQPKESEKLSAIGSWSHATGLDGGIDITIRSDGTAEVAGWRTQSETPIPFTYTVEDGVLSFKHVSEGMQRSFTARYDEENDVLKVTMDGSTVDYHRENADINGKWSLTAIEYSGTEYDPSYSRFCIYLEFSENEAKVTATMADLIESGAYGYVVSGYTIEMMMQDPADPLLEIAPVASLRYDPFTDRLTYTDNGVTLIFSRTPDVEIPVKQRLEAGEGEWFYQFKPGYFLYVTVGDGYGLLKITDNGKTLEDARYVCTVEDQTLRFASAYEAETAFTAVYDKEKDVLTVTLNDLPMPFTRIHPELVGKWTAVGLEVPGSTDRPYIMGSITGAYLEFSEDGTATFTAIVQEEGIRETYGYTMTGNTVELKTDGQIVGYMTYDAEEKALRLDRTDLGGKIVFYRTNGQIPLLPGEEAKDVTSLRAEYPEYFDLDTIKGLKVYVWQETEDAYACALLSASDSRSDAEIGAMRGTTVEQMRLILSTYDVPPKRLSIVPFRNPLSSFSYEIDDAYTAWVTALIKDGSDVLDAMIYDIDKDGRLETCKLTKGPSTDCYTLVFTAYRNGVVAYRNTFRTEAGKLLFAMNGQDHVIKRMSVNVSDGTEAMADRYTIWFSDGRIHLTKMNWNELEYWNPYDPEWNMGFDTPKEWAFTG